MARFPLSENKNLPSPPSFTRLLGPSFIILGLGLGSGELILWPYLSSNYGLGMAWAIVIGVTMQFFINMEVSRHALIYGESIFVGFARWIRFLPFWFILSTFIGFGWPGIGLASATLFSHLLPGASLTLVALALFIGIGLILTIGKQLYSTVEKLQKWMIMGGTPFVILLTFILAKPHHWQSLAQGVIGQGAGFSWLPTTVPLATFLGALAFSGAGGNLNLAQSFYVRDKGYGMGAFAQKISSLFRHAGTGIIKLSGTTFPLTPANISRFRAWWRISNLEHFIVFLVLGLITMLTLSLLAYITTFGHPDNPEGISFVIREAQYIGAQTLPVIGMLFLVVSGCMLAATQLTVLDSTSRIITENVLLLTGSQRARVGVVYYIILWLQIAFSVSIILAGFTQPRTLITLSAALNAVAMFVYIALLLVHHNTRLPSPLRPSPFRNLALGGSFLFFGYFCLLTLKNLF